jgi:ATP-dependent Lon protease
MFLIRVAEQEFCDHYLEVELDPSDVLLIATANVAEAILEPLMDRMEPIAGRATPRPSVGDHVIPQVLGSGANNGAAEQDSQISEPPAEARGTPPARMAGLLTTPRCRGS